VPLARRAAGLIAIHAEKENVNHVGEKKEKSAQSIPLVVPHLLLVKKRVEANLGAKNLAKKANNHEP